MNRHMPPNEYTKRKKLKRFIFVGIVFVSLLIPVIIMLIRTPGVSPTKSETRSGRSGATQFDSPYPYNGPGATKADTRLWLQQNGGELISEIPGDSSHHDILEYHIPGKAHNNGSREEHLIKLEFEDGYRTKITFIGATSYTLERSAEMIANRMLCEGTFADVETLGYRPLSDYAWGVAWKMIKDNWYKYHYDDDKEFSQNEGYRRFFTKYNEEVGTVHIGTSPFFRLVEAYEQRGNLKRLRDEGINKVKGGQSITLVALPGDAISR